MEKYFYWLFWFNSIILIILYSKSIKASCSSSFDNLDQSLSYKLKDENHKKQLQKQILNIFGIKNKPISSINLKKNSNTNYLNNIYNQYSKYKNEYQNENIFNNSKLNFNISAIEESDVIISFDSQYLKYNESYKFYRFNLSKVQDYDEVLKTELLILNREETKNLTKILIEIENNKKIFKNKYDIENKNGFIKIDLLNILNNINITKNLDVKLYFVKENITIKSSFINKPFIITYLKNNNGVLDRFKRNSKSDNSETSWNFFSNRIKKGYQKKTCQLNSFYISFQDLGWNNWIIAPEGYSSYFCSGECLFPLKESLNTTNHAIVQSFMQLLNPQNYPKPCCAAIELSSIELLYLDDDQNVTWKKYKNMIPKSCGCI